MPTLYYQHTAASIVLRVDKLSPKKLYAIAVTTTTTAT